MLKWFNSHKQALKKIGCIPFFQTIISLNKNELSKILLIDFIKCKKEESEKYLEENKVEAKKALNLANDFYKKFYTAA